MKRTTNLNGRGKSLVADNQQTVTAPTPDQKFEQWLRAVPPMPSPLVVNVRLELDGAAAEMLPAIMGRTGWTLDEVILPCGQIRFRDHKVVRSTPTFSLLL